ncbi:hypothetical protein TNCV_4728691 [Trichonephila clavipes]|nr:hypothetical protein TNCV_4728691 [Trichonephila clavipes]
MGTRLRKLKLVKKLSDGKTIGGKGRLTDSLIDKLAHYYVMSRKKQRPAFDQVSEFDRGRIVAYRDCGLSFRKFGSRVGRN